jgi:hypothetical protein
MTGIGVPVCYFDILRNQYLSYLNILRTRYSSDLNILRTDTHPTLIFFEPIRILHIYNKNNYLD